MFFYIFVEGFVSSYNHRNGGKKMYNFCILQIWFCCVNFLVLFSKFFNLGPMQEEEDVDVSDSCRASLDKEHGHPEAKGDL